MQNVKLGLALQHLALCAPSTCCRLHSRWAWRRRCPVHAAVGGQSQGGCLVSAAEEVLQSWLAASALLDACLRHAVERTMSAVTLQGRLAGGLLSSCCAPQGCCEWQ